MYKPKVFIFIMTVAFCFMFNVQVFAFYRTLQIDNPNYYLSYHEGDIIPLDSKDPDVRPIIRDGSTLLPLQGTLNTLNFDGPVYYEAQWDADERKISIMIIDASEYMPTRKVAEFWVDKTTAVYYDENGENGKTATLPSPPVIIGGRTYLPVRGVVDAFDDLLVQWVPSKNGIVIYDIYDRPETVVFPDGTTADF